MKSIIKIHLLLLFVILLPACHSVHFVTKPNYPSEAALVADAYHNGLTAELDIPYQQAYQNLKQAYQQCVAFTTENDLVYSDNRLEDHLEMGTILIKVYPMLFLQKTLVEGLSEGRTRITLFLPKKYPSAQARFKRDLLRALGNDPECNIGTVIPL